MKRKIAGLWILNVWSSSLILPIVLSYRDKSFNITPETIDSFNVISFIHIHKINYQVMTNSWMNDFALGLQYNLTMFPFRYGWGINFVAIVFVFIILFILFQNYSRFGKIKTSLFLFVMIMSAIIPFLVYHYCQARYETKFNNLRDLALNNWIYRESEPYKSLNEKCVLMSNRWFMFDNDNLIEKVTCDSDNQTVVVAKIKSSKAASGFDIKCIEINANPSEEAINKFKEALIDKPDFVEAWYGWGIALENSGQHEEAIEKFEKAVTYKPNYAVAWYGWGLVLENSGKREEAIEKFDKAVACRPDFAEAWYCWGAALEKSGKREEAIEKFEKAVTYKPNYAEARCNWGAALEKSGKHEEAIEKFKEATKYKPNYAEARLK
ncbi:tetratricopeptide repeat protein [Desulfobacterium sp. N47]|uniref:tetratricopeptide repeat protein n=1 Tax=Desulfobacterium sp. N47 TaxID=3115210 RepID=UPI003F4A59A7